MGSGSIEISNCIFSGTVAHQTSTIQDGAACRAAAFVGYTNMPVTITNCAMYGTISNVSAANGEWCSGIIGQASNDVEISNVIVAGNVQTYVDATDNETKAKYILGSGHGSYTVTISNAVIVGDAVYASAAATVSEWIKVSKNDILGPTAQDALNEAEITGFVASENAGELPVLTPENVIIVNAASHLQDFATQLNAGTTFAGKTITMTADINLNPNWDGKATAWSSTAPADVSYKWPTMTSVTFAGNFNGNGHTIEGIYYIGAGTSGVSASPGIFGHTGSADVRIENFTIARSYFQAGYKAQTSALVYHSGASKLTIDRVHVENGVIYNAQRAPTAFYVGAAYGAGSVEISNCVFSGSVVQGSTGLQESGKVAPRVAAFVGYAENTITIENCAMYGTVSNAGETNGEWCSGFIAQQAKGSATISNVIVAGNVQTYVDAEDNKTKAKYILGVHNDGVTVAATKVIVPPDGDVTFATGGATVTQITNKTRAELALGTGAQTVLEATGFTTFVASSLPNGLPVPKGTVTNRVYDGITELAGYQTKPTDAGTGVRLVGIADIDSTDFVNYEFVGFHVVAYASDASKYQTVNTFYHETKNLYTSIAAGDGTWSPAPTTDGNPPYIFVQEIKNIPAIGEVIFEVTSFSQKKDGTVIIGKTSTVTVDTGVKETQTPDGVTASITAPLLNGSSASYTEINDTAYLAYKTKLANAGAVEQQTTDLDGNLFSTYFHSGIQYNLSYYPSTDMLKVHITNKAYMPSTSGTLANGEVWQLGLEMPTGSAPGMSYVAKVGENEFVVVDGGLNSENNIAALKTILGSNTPTVHWVFTHNHPDHVGLASAFIGQYADEINLATVAHSFTVKSGDAGILALARQNGAKIWVMHAGQEVYIGGCKITVLSTHEELYTAEISALKNANAESTVFKMTFANGSMLVLGDATTMVANHLTQYFTSTTLDADVLQAAHHGTVASDDVDDGTGYASALETLYTKVNPSKVALPNQTNSGVLGASGYGNAEVLVAGTSGSQKLIG